jgi:hypothetical protein
MHNKVTITKEFELIVDKGIVVSTFTIDRLKNIIIDSTYTFYSFANNKYYIEENSFDKLLDLIYGNR